MWHNHNHHTESQWITLAFWLNLGFSIVEIVGWLLTNSTAIIADAFHDFGDAMAIGLAVLLEKFSRKKRDNHFTYGYRRFSLLAALIMSVILLVGAVLMSIEAIQSFFEPKTVNSLGMFLLAIFGIVVNGIAFLRIKSAGWHSHDGHEHSNNGRAVMLHLLEDVLGWVAVLVGSTIMYFTGRYWIDGVLVLGIAVFIVYNATNNLLDTMKILLQSAPENVSVDEIKKELLALTDIEDVHDMHVWSMDGEYTVASMHIVMKKNLTKEQHNDILAVLKKNHIDHPTIQFEPFGCEGGGC